MSRFSIALIRLATLALLGSAGTAAYAQQTIDQNKALAGNVTPGDAPGFPITLSVPGHYKLMSNLQVPAGVDGVELTASGITLDLNGFNIIGPTTCTRVTATRVVTCTAATEGTGVRASNVNQSVIRNGTVRGFFNGVHANRALISNVIAAQNAQMGFMGDDVLIDSSLAEINAMDGYYLQRQSSVSRSIARSNGRQGVLAPYIQESTAIGNRTIGLNGSAFRASISVGNGQNVGGLFVSQGGNLNGNTPF